MDNKNINLLIVDDNKTNLQVVSSYLKEKGYQLALAVNASDALKILNGNKIDLILLDIMMPDMDGFELCRILKKDANLKDIPVIFLSAKVDTEDVVKGFQVGGVDYLSKPFQKEELFARVNNHLQIKLIRDVLKTKLNESEYSKGLLLKILNDLGNILELNG
jgi:PleD family two-component response regulator